MEGKSMKKIFIALSVLAALTMGVGSALAVPGVPDNSPGSDFTVPFLVSKARVVDGAGPTTVLNLTEVGGFEVKFDIVIYNTKSEIGPSDRFEITPWGTVMLDVSTILEDASSTARKALEITFDEETYYAGYITAKNYVYSNTAKDYVRGTVDNVIGSFYFLDLDKGKSGASNLPMREFYNQQEFGWYWPTWAITQSTPDLIVNDSYPDFRGQNLYERWSGIALTSAQSMVYNGFTFTKQYGDTTGTEPDDWWWAPAAAWFAFYPEYYILDQTGSTTFVLYQNGLPNGSDFHMYVINAAEDYKDTSMTINEVTFIDAETNVPDGLKVKYPYQGIFNWTSTNQYTSIANDDILWAEFLGWSWQKADNGATSAATNWTIMKQMARDAGTVLTDTAAPEPF